MKYLYLHGLGQKPDSWNRVIKETKVSKSSCSLSLSELLERKSATYKARAKCAFSSGMSRLGEETTNKLPESTMAIAILL